MAHIHRYTLEHVAGLDGLIPCWWLTATGAEGDVPNALRELESLIDAGKISDGGWHPRNTGELYGMRAQEACSELGFTSAATVLAATVLQTEKAAETLFHHDLLCSYRLWVNGECLVDLWETDTPTLANGQVPVVLKAGTNYLALEIPGKVFQERRVVCGRLAGDPLPPVYAVGSTDSGSVDQPDEKATHPDFSPFAAFARKTSRPHILAFPSDGSTPVDDWQAQFRYEFLRLFGPFPERVPLNPQVTHRETIDGIACERILLRSDPETTLPVYLYLPPDANGRALAVLHGHMTREGAPGHFRPPSGSNVPLKMAKQGYIVITPIFRSFGERHESRPLSKRDPCDIDFFRYLLYGESSLKYQVNDALRTIDYLLTRDEVDLDRFGLTGLSYGGRTTMYVAALDKRAKAYLASGAMNLLKERLAIGSSCGGQFLPGLLRYGDTSEVFGLIAPRPLMLQLGTNDGTSPEIYAAEVDRRVRAVYRAFGDESRYAVDVFHGGHLYNVETATAWFDTWL